MNNRMVRNVVVLLVFSFIIPVFGADDGNGDNGVAMLRRTGKAFAKVAATAIPAVVSVKVEKSIEVGGGVSPGQEELFEYFFGPRYRHRAPRERKQVGQGSGFIISKDGYILSNHHVVGAADKITVTLHDGREMEAELIGSDEKSDVAVIKIEGDGLDVISLGDSESLEIGEWAIAVGNPFGLEASVTVGVVSATGRSNLGITGVGGYEDFIQTDAAINPGNSGGPLLNIDGEAIGLNTAIFSQSGGYMGIGFAIPINMAKNVKDQLVEFGKVNRGFIGIEMDPQNISSDLAKLFELKKNKGVIVTGVLEGSPAEKGGVEKDDVIIELDGKEVDNFLTFRNSIAMLSPGTEIKLVVWRGSKEVALKIKIGSQEESRAFGSVSSDVGRQFGLEVKDVDKELAEKYGLDVEEGVVLSKVVKGSSAEGKGLREGVVILSVNRIRVSSVAEFNAIFDALGDEKIVWLNVRGRGGYASYVVLKRE